MSDLKREFGVNAVGVQELDFRTQPAPDRALIFEMRLSNLSAVHLTLIRSWVDVKVQNIRIAHGDLLRLHTASGAPATIPPGDSKPGEVVATVSREGLGMIEDRRDGGDVEFWINMYAQMAAVSQGRPRHLGPPAEVALTRDGKGGAVKGEIPRSKWINMLRQLGWKETELIEIPAGRIRGRFPNALEAYEEAVRHHRRGEWRRTLASCREVFEAVAWTRTPKGANQADMTAVAEILGTSPRGQKLNATIKAFGEFLHLGRHLSDGSEEIEAKDSLMALHITAGLLRYLGD